MLTTRGTALDAVESALGRLGLRVIHRGDSALSAQCPAHDDADPSLSVNYRKGTPGRVLMKCHAGCDIAAVLDALGLTMRDLFDGSPVEVRYTYDNGREVIRTYPDGAKKRIHQRNADRPAELYQLALVQEAIDAGQLVYVAEGEEDVATLDVLAAPARIAATTAPQGASNWACVDYSVLVGGSAVIVTDNDDAGTRRALGLADHLEGLGVDVWCVMTARVGNDVTDAFAAWDREEPMTLDDLRCEPVESYRARVRPPSTPEAGDWGGLDITSILDAIVAGDHEPERPALVTLSEGGALLYPGRVHSIMGESGSGKSWCALAAAKQEMELGHAVVYIDLEDAPAGVVGRLLALGTAQEVIRSRLVYMRPDTALTDAAREGILTLIRELSPSLVIIDSVGEAMALDGLKQNDDDAVAVWMRRLPRSIAAHGPAVLLLDHVVKAEGERGLWAIGSQRKRAAIDGAAYVIEVRERDAFSAGRPGRARLICAKDRHGTFHRGQHVANMHVTPEGGQVDIRLFAVVGEVEATSTLEADITVMERLQPTSRRKARELSKGMSNTRADLAYDAWIKRQEGLR
ncbi:AAA family ATPase [Microbacterium resistens]|uniref:AAA family ATPase n=1 Tax=Microbacterium resistens TaxID=156977 RepID=UPI001C559BBB|nr:AAA family ATPase [Microbacterium resistens]MBW1639567.1 AAA family ATPase [Microbacterium resistens]